ncbi:unnamed protein product [Symbiodinium necroappetens]|uniref:Uncharacterized protein n=1 Tax=Symbiodinium necroappetens TaxID=1628268 RepID=A0A812UQP6_9DINO|nr:unnamed protein product [Symbiodinium necroappetens]
MEQDGSLFLSHVDIVSKLAACDCISSTQPDADEIGSNKYSGVALQLPSEPKQLALAAHSTGALTKGKVAIASLQQLGLNPLAAVEVFFTELQPFQAAEIARRFFGDDFSVVAAPDEGEDWRLLPEVPLSPTAPPLIVAGLPVSRAAEAVKQLQDAGHTLLYVGAAESEVKAVEAASIPSAFGLCGCQAVQSAADVVLLSDFVGSLAFAKWRCSMAVTSPEKYEVQLQIEFRVEEFGQHTFLCVTDSQ